MNNATAALHEKHKKQYLFRRYCSHLDCYFVYISHLAELAASLAAEKMIDVVDISIC